MKIDILQEIIEKKISKKRFAVLTNLMNGKSELFEKHLNAEIVAFGTKLKSSRL